MNRILRAALLVLGVLSPLAITLPVSAASALKPHVAYPALTSAVIESFPQYAASDYQVFNNLTVTLQSPANAPSNILFTWNGPPTNGGADPRGGNMNLVIPNGVIQAGQIYTDDNGAIVNVDGIEGCQGVASAGNPAEVEVDQLVISNGAVQSAAVQFFCQAGADPSGGSINGTFAYNVTPTTPGQGYYVFGDDGSLASFGNDSYLSYLGDLSYYNLNQPIVGMATTADDAGYWYVASDGGIFDYGDAGFYGSTGNLTLNKPIVGMAATPDGKGYWLVASDGGIFAFGDAPYEGSTGSLHLNKPIVGMAVDPLTGGYWLVASDGGIFAFNAPFLGSTGSLHLNQPVVGMAATPDGNGYWFVASDGGIFSEGDAPFYGSAGSLHLTLPIVGMRATPDGKGYWFVASDGGIFDYGDAPYDGSLGGLGITNVAGIAS